MTVYGYPSFFVYCNYEHWNLAPKSDSIFLYKSLPIYIMKPESEHSAR